MATVGGRAAKGREAVCRLPLTCSLRTVGAAPDPYNEKKPSLSESTEHVSAYS